MGMNLALRSEEGSGFDDRTWLGSAHGTDVAETITVKASSLVGTWADGKVPSGVVVSRDADDRYILGDAGSGGHAGHLLEPVRFDPDLPGGEVLVTTALLWHGRVIVDNLPANSGYAAISTPDAVPQIRYVTGG